jgi:omega-amidase
MELTVSIAQMDVAQAVPQHNLKRGLALIEEAARRGSDLVCLPEMWTTGLNWSRNRHCAAEQETVHAAIAELAARYSLWISSPMLRVSADGAMYNSSFLFAPDGRQAACYDKIHLFSPFHEDRFICAGSSLCVAETPWGPTGLCVCYDLRFPELFRAYALQDVVLQICSAAFPHSRQEHWRVLVRARAIENQFFVLAVNRSGSEDLGSAGQVVFGGSSTVIDPWGNTLIEADTQECLLTACLDTGLRVQARTAIPVFEDRRPDLYKL